MTQLLQDKEIQDCKKHINPIKKIVGERSTIADSQELSIKDKKAKLERKKQVINETSQVLANQQRTIENAKNSIVNATNIGCKSKDEYSTIIRQMTQQKSTKSELQKMRIEQNLSSFQSSKNEKKTIHKVLINQKLWKKQIIIQKIILHQVDLPT